MNRFSRAVALTALLLAPLALAATPPAAEKAVSGWRGDGSGIFAGATPPTTWDAESKKNILWTVKIPKSIHSPPIVVRGKIFLASEPNMLTCLDASNGKELWSKTTSVDDLPQKVDLVPLHPDVGNSTPTPASDGQSVFMELADGLVTRFDLDGNRKWIAFIDEPCATGNGRSASPVLAGGKLVLSMGKMIALDAETGKVAWKADKVPESYGTPLPVKIGEATALIAPSGEIVSAADGKILAKTSGELMYASPIIADNTIFFIDLDSCAAPLAGDKTAEKKKWQVDLEGEFFASPVVHKGLVYAVSNQGHLFVIDAVKGKLLYDKQLEIASMGGGGGTANLYPSLCLANNRIYISNDKGETLVLEPGEEYKEVAKNALNDVIVGTPAFAGKRIYVRTPESLICIGE